MANANTLDPVTTGSITATIATDNFSNLSTLTSTNNNYTLNVSDASISVASANILDAITTGVITATIEEDSATDLATLTGTGNAYSITIATGAATAADLNTIDAATTVPVDASNVTAVSGLYGDINTAINSAGITGLGDETYTVSDVISVTQANDLDAFTSGVITATIEEVGAADLATLTGTNAYTIRISAGAATATELETIDDSTTIQVDASLVTSITGAYSNLNDLYSAPGIGNLGDEALVVTDETISIAQANNLDDLTTGVITATVTANSQADLLGLNTSSNNFSFILETATLSIDEANQLDAATTEAITATVNSDTARNLSNLTNLNDNNLYSITVLPGTASAEDLNKLDDVTSLPIDASSVTAITGNSADLLITAQAGDSGSIDGITNTSLIFTDEELNAASFTQIRLLNSGSLDASAATSVSGGASEVLNAYQAEGTAGLGNESVILFDGTVTTSTLNAINQLTTGKIDISDVSALSGSATDLYASLIDRSVIGEKDLSLVFTTDESLNYKDLKKLDNATNALIDVENSDSVASTLNQVVRLQGLDGITNFSSLDIELTNNTTRLLRVNSNSYEAFNSASNRDDFRALIRGSRIAQNNLIGTSNDDRVLGGKFADELTGLDGKDKLRGKAGSDVLTGGDDGDRMWGGRGEADTFRYNALTESLLADYDWIRDLEIGLDEIQGVTAVADVNILGKVSSMTQEDIADLLTNAEFSAGTAATFKYKTDTFLAINDGVDGFDESADSIIKITGYKGSLDDLTIS